MSELLIPRVLLAVSTVLLGAVSSANAEFSIQIGSGTIDPGGLLTLEIGIDSDSPPELLSDYDLILQITPMTATGSSSLQFVDPQSEAFLDDADYVFANTSEAIAEGDTTSTVVSPTEITFFDISTDVDGNFLNVPVTTGQVLASLELQHNLGGQTAAATAGDQFEVSLSLLSGFFQESGAEVDYFSNVGTVTVNAVAIPEPGAAAFLILATSGMVLRRKRRGRTV